MLGPVVPGVPSKWLFLMPHNTSTDSNPPRQGRRNVYLVNCAAHNWLEQYPSSPTLRTNINQTSSSFGSFSKGLRLVAMAYKGWSSLLQSCSQSRPNIPVKIVSPSNSFLGSVIASCSWARRAASQKIAPLSHCSSVLSAALL